MILSVLLQFLESDDAMIIAKHITYQFFGQYFNYRQNYNWFGGVFFVDNSVIVIAKLEIFFY